jgi:hypothetical protein
MNIFTDKSLKATNGIAKNVKKLNLSYTPSGHKIFPIA